MPGRIAFVTPRFGPGVVGGSEAVSREVARGLAGRGWEVEVLTTCAVDHYGWANELPAGEAVEDGVVVRRFEVLHHGSRAGLRAQLKVVAGQALSPDEQLCWLGWQFTVPDLFHYLLRHGKSYDVVVFSPYLYWTTTACLPLVAERAVSMPCLHDEIYARLEVVRHVLADPAIVWFLSEPEHEVAHRLGPVAAYHRVTGAGVEVPSSYDPDRFRQKYGIKRPYVLFAGRREAGKGWEWLLDTYARAVAMGGIELDLLSVGVGEVEVPPELEGRVIDLGFLPDADRNDAFAGAAAYLQPSRMESFSRTIMEAWLATTPVLAVAGSEVVGWHCERSGGGATFSNAEELAALLRWLQEFPWEAREMAERGRRYVLDTYSWPVVLDAMEASLDHLVQPAGRASG